MLRPGIPIAVAAIALLLVAPIAPAAQEQPAADRPSSPSVAAFSPDHVLVEWATHASRGDRGDAREDAGVESAAKLGSGRFQLLEVEPGQSARSAVRALRGDPAVVAAERDGYVAPNAIPDDPLFDQLWGLQNLGGDIDGVTGAVAGADIDAPTAWDSSVGDPATLIADIDSGYRFEHPDLAGVAWANPGEIPANGEDDDGNGFADDLRGYDFIGADGEAPAPDPDPTDDDLLTGGHGVHTAGTIGAQGDNGIGITGVAQDARIMPLRVCSHFAISDENLCRFSAMVGAINYAGDNGARVANMSIGNTINSPIVRDAIAANPEVLFVISAGNDGEDNDSVPHYPCNFNPLAEGKSAVDNVVCVAATDQADGLAGFSDWGATSVDLGAPGTEILSTYPKRHLLDEDFEIDDFATQWEATGADGGFARTDEAPLSSFGMSDSPGAAPVAGAVKASRSVAVALPPGFGDCTLEQRRAVSLGGGEYRYDVLLDGAPVAGATPGDNLEPKRFQLDLGDDLTGGGEVSVRFRYTVGPAPGEPDGVWLDEIDLHCVEPVGQASGYEFQQGTSMAAPHVSGTAGLLFSLEPSASVTEVKNALLASVDPVPALAGKTVTGGRLDAAAAIATLAQVDLDPPSPPVLTTTDPPSPAPNPNPRILGAAEPGSTIAIYAGPACDGAPVANGSAAMLVSPGIGVIVPATLTIEFTARATDAAANVSACSSPLPYTNSSPKGTVVITGPFLNDPPPNSPSEPPPPPVCTVPKLAGKTLAQAKAALAGARCTLGKVMKPRLKKGRKLPRLVVKSSSPAAGASPSSPVNLTLGPKPKRPRH